MPGGLSGKVCVITGTGGSMGRESALAFAREGALVVGCDLAVEAAETTVEAVRAAGGEMVSMHPCRLTETLRRRQRAPHPPQRPMHRPEGGTK